MKTKPIGIRFEQDEYDAISAYAARRGMTFSDAVRRGAMSYVDPDYGRGYRSLAEIAASADEASPQLAFSQFLDDFAHASDKQALIADEPEWESSAGAARWPYDFAATAHKLAHDNDLPVPRWVLEDRYIAPRPYYAFDTDNEEFQAYLRETTPREFQWHNLFLGPNILQRA